MSATRELLRSTITLPMWLWIIVNTAAWVGVTAAIWLAVTG